MHDHANVMRWHAASDFILFMSSKALIDLYQLKLNDSILFVYMLKNYGN